MSRNEMKILHINCNYMGTKLHQVMIEHLEKLVKINSVFCPIYKGSELVTKPNNNVVVSQCFNFMDRFFFFNKQKKIISSIEKNMNINKHNIIHAYTLFTDGNAAYELSRKYNIPYVVAVRSTDIEFFTYRLNLRKRGIEILENASAVFFLAKSTQDKVMERYIPENKKQGIVGKSYIIPNGIDDFWIDNIYSQKEINKTVERINNKELNIICVAQIIKRKNIPMIQKSVSVLKEEGWKVKFRIIGKVVDQKEYKRITKDLNTEWIAPVSKEKLITYYREADLFVLPSKFETFGLVYAEAMSQALPVIYLENEGFDGQFEEGTVGYRTKDDKNILVNKIKKACENYKTISCNCVEKVHVFTWKNICGEYFRIYNEILNNDERSSV